MYMKFFSHNKYNKMLISIFTILVLALSSGIIYATINDVFPEKSNNEIIIESSQVDTNVDDTVIDREIENDKNVDTTNKVGKISDELRAKLLADLPHSTRIDISISEDEKIKLYKEGFSFEEIDAAIMFANDKQDKDVIAFLKNNIEEIRSFAKKLKDAPVKDKKDMLDEKIMNSLISKGNSRNEINLAYFASKQLGVSIEEALLSFENGDADFLKELKSKVDEVKNSEN